MPSWSSGAPPLVESADGALVVRGARPEEYAAIGVLTVDAYGADKQLDDNEYAKTLANVAHRADVGEVFVAVDGAGELVGSVTFVLPGTPYAELSGPGEAEFRMLAVAPAAWGRGVGELLARACIERARQVGATAIMICTRDFATSAHRIYERLGFVRVPDRDWTPIPGVRLLALRLAL